MKKLWANFLVLYFMAGQIFGNIGPEVGESLSPIFVEGGEAEGRGRDALAARKLSRQAKSRDINLKNKKPKKEIYSVKAKKRSSGFEFDEKGVDPSSGKKPLKKQQEARRKTQSSSDKNPVVMFGESRDSESDKPKAAVDGSQDSSDSNLKTTPTETKSGESTSRGAAVTAHMSSDAQAKITKIKESLKTLQENTLVGGVFMELGIHGDFDEILKSMSQKADTLITQSDLDKVQTFLADLVSRKDQILKLQSTTRDQFLNKFKTVIQNNFTDLSISEMGDFFNATNELVKKAESVSVEKEAKSKSQNEDAKPPKKSAKKPHGFGKGMMHHGSGDASSAGWGGAMFGLAFAMALFVLVQELSDQGV